jgi:hypothetical protein
LQTWFPTTDVPVESLALLPLHPLCSPPASDPVHPQPRRQGREGRGQGAGQGRWKGKADAGLGRAGGGASAKV